MRVDCSSPAQHCTGIARALLHNTLTAGYSRQIWRKRLILQSCKSCERYEVHGEGHPFPTADDVSRPDLLRTSYDQRWPLGGHRPDSTCQTGKMKKTLFSNGWNQFGFVIFMFSSARMLSLFRGIHQNRYREPLSAREVLTFLGVQHVPWRLKPSTPLAYTVCQLYF